MWQPTKSSDLTSLWSKLTDRCSKRELGNEGPRCGPCWQQFKPQTSPIPVRAGKQWLPSNAGVKEGGEMSVIIYIHAF